MYMYKLRKFNLIEQISIREFNIYIYIKLMLRYDHFAN